MVELARKILELFYPPYTNYFPCILPETHAFPERSPAKTFLPPRARSEGTTSLQASRRRIQTSVTHALAKNMLAAVWKGNLLAV